MTWRTPDGERVLSGAEAKLFASALACMMDLADDSGEGLNFGMPLVAGPFEKLSQSHKYLALEQVAQALLRPTATCPELTAVYESAIYYVFAWLKQEFDDVESAEEVWGQKVLDAAEAVGDVAEDELDEAYRPQIGCLDPERWELALEGLADHILWDRDFEMEAEFGGGANQALMAQADVDPNYFQPFQAGREARGAKDRLYELVRSVEAAP